MTSPVGDVTRPRGRVVAHVAGTYDRRTLLQSCARCGFILKDNNTHADGTWTVAGTPYPEGATIERGPGWQAMLLGQGLGQPCTGDAHG
jgi:hypothetical protein